MKLGVVVSIATVAAAAVVAAATATPPGSNGRIAFTRYADSTRSAGAIFTISPNGRGERRLTRPPAGAVDFQPDWSPDGSRIVFQREFDDKPYETWIVHSDGSDPQQADPGCPPGIPPTEICEENEPAWSPDGRRLAFAWAYGKLKQIAGEEWIEVSGIGVMDADGSNVKQLTQLRRPTSSEDQQPVWSPDGKRIAFQRENSTASPSGVKSIFVIGADGRGLRQVTPWRLDAGDHPDWSPDGRRILFRAPEHFFAGSNLWTVRPDGTGLKQLTHFRSTIEVLSASYSPDGKWIVLSRTGRAGQPDLFAIRPDGTGLRQITRTPGWDSAPDWGPR
jgi:Tol biopolymer transport system component